MQEIRALTHACVVYAQSYVYKYRYGKPVQWKTIQVQGEPHHVAQWDHSLLRVEKCSAL